jgi:acetyl/propionyl-CoA carboxylase alpha subunit
VQKGQVVCIIEAMKLMNEIEVSVIFLLHLVFIGDTCNTSIFHMLACPLLSLY